MTLLICTAAAVVSTIIWYNSKQARECKIGTLSLMYWGASLMWFIDSVAEYFELKDAFFTPDTAEMINDSYLGLSVVVLGLVIWSIIFIVKDPKHVIADILSKNAAK